MVGQIKTRVYWGPSILAPFAAVVAEFENPNTGMLPLREVSQLLAELYPDLPPLELKLAGNAGDFASVAAVLANTWQERIWQNALPPAVTRSEAGKCRIALNFYDQELATDILLAAIHMTGVFFTRASDASPRLESQTPIIQRVLNLDYGRPLSKTAATLCRLSRARGIPVYTVSETAGILQYGQGIRGLHYRELANQQDSVTGFVLARRKDLTAEFLRRLGFPVTDQQTASNLDAAREICGEIGYPLVVKPVDRGKGIGVSVGIKTSQQLDRAFKQAHAASFCGEVVVERFVAGDDHRLNVFGGKFVSAVRLLPPKIVGDGRRTVSVLIEEASIKRSKDPAANFFPARLTADASMRALLRRQGFELSDKPPAGHELRLRETSNLHTGGTREEVTSRVHPDNAEMAEAIARDLRAEAIGIDFITPDISEPWHETACAIIEVNNNPGTGDQELLEKYLLEKFPAGDDGRIPGVLVVGNDPEICQSVVCGMEAGGRRVGYTSGKLTRIGGQPRLPGSADLPARILRLVLDATCESLVVCCSADEIADHGLAYMRYDLALIGESESLSSGLRQLIDNNTSQVIDQVTSSMLEDRILPALRNLLKGK